MQQAEAELLAAELAAAYPRYPIANTTRSWWADLLLPLDAATGKAAVWHAAQFYTSAPSVAELREAIRAVRPVPDPRRDEGPKEGVPMPADVRKRMEALIGHALPIPRSRQGSPARAAEWTEANRRRQLKALETHYPEIQAGANEATA